MYSTIEGKMQFLGEVSHSAAPQRLSDKGNALD